ncbi:MAG: phosphopantetheine-binding protein, partial [Nevskiales bacterium]
MQDPQRRTTSELSAESTAHADFEAALLAIVRQTWADLHRRSPTQINITLDSSLDRELGFDSLARVELL